MEVKYPELIFFTGVREFVIFSSKSCVSMHDMEAKHPELISYHRGGGKIVCNNLVQNVVMNFFSLSRHKKFSSFFFFSPVLFIPSIEKKKVL